MRPTSSLSRHSVSSSLKTTVIGVCVLLLTHVARSGQEITRSEKSATTAYGRRVATLILTVSGVLTGWG